jgi:hypothetical protein
MAAITIKVINVVEGEGEIWRVENGESGEVLGISPDKHEALEMARQAAQIRGAEVVLQSRAGGIDWIEDYEWGWEASQAASVPATVKVVSVVACEAQTWLIEGDLPGEVIGASADKAQAIEMARGEAQHRHAQLIVHEPNGDIEWTEDYAWAEADHDSAT